MSNLHKFHRYTGVGSAILVLILSITGLLLNSTDLELDQRFISNSWLLKQYSLGEFPVQSYAASDTIVSKSGRYLYLNNEAVSEMNESLVGSIALQQDILIALPNSLLLISKEGEVIDQLFDYSGLPERPQALMVDTLGLVLLKGQNAVWQSDSNLSAWQQISRKNISWPDAIETPSVLSKEIQRHARTHEISLERMLLDLHSGRLFGKIGETLMSLSAVALIFLALSGVYVWSRRQ
jgi:hypothetical protein